MKLPRIFRQLLTLFSVGVFASGGGLLNKIYAAGVVSTPDQASLSAALQGGGLVTFECDGTIYLTNTITIGADTVLDGSGRSIAISGSNAVRVFYVNTNTSLLLNGLSVVEGFSTNGAGVYNDGGAVTVANCTFSGNKALGKNGVPTYSDITNGAPHTPSTPGGEGSGGAFYNTGNFHLFNSLVVSNEATGGVGGGGGGYSPSPAEVGGPGYGGAILNRGAVVITGSSLLRNNSFGGRGADVVYPLSPAPEAGPGGPASGAAIFNSGSLSVTNSMFQFNASVGGSSGGGSIYGLGGSVRGGVIHNFGGNAQLVGCTLNNSSASGGSGGGGFRSFPGDVTGGVYFNSNGGVADFSDCILAHNQSGGLISSGGAVYNANGTVSFRSSEISYNQIHSTSFSRYNIGDGMPARGGAIYNADNLVLNDTELTGNRALGGNGVFPQFGDVGSGGAADGGALYNIGKSALSNCVLTANIAAGGRGAVSGAKRGKTGLSAGGAICNEGGLVLQDCLVTANSTISSDTGGAAGVFTTQPMAVSSSIIVSNTLSLDLYLTSFGTGTNLVFTVSGNNLPETGYKWFFPETNLIEGIDSRSYSKANAQTNDVGVYRVEAEDSIGGRRLLSLNMAPRIATQPSAQFTIPGDSATFSVDTEGSEPIFYQWRLDGVDIVGATGASYTLTNAQNENVGNHSLFASNQFGSVISSNAPLVLITQPVLQVPLQNQIAPRGSNVTFAAQFQGNVLSYQWSFNAVTIPGATKSSYSFSAQHTNIGSYSVFVSNIVGTATASADFNMAPFVVTHPIAKALLPGKSVTFASAAHGSMPITYQWRFKGSNIAGATRSTYSLSNLQLSNGGNYSLLVSNRYGSAISSNAVLTVITKPEVLALADKVADRTEWVQFDATARGGALSYQWYFNSRAIAGETNSTLRFRADGGRVGLFTVVVFNVLGSARVSARLDLIPWVHTFEPQTPFVAPGSNVTFRVSAKGSLPIFYQWNFNGVAIPHATGSSYSLPVVTTAETGRYSVVFSNAFGSAGKRFDLKLGNVIHWQATNGSSTCQYVMWATVVGSKSSGLPKMSAAWHRIGLADFNKDRQSDYLWRNTNGALAVSLMKGTQQAGTVLLRSGIPLSPSWRFVGVGDFNRDGNDDLLWQNGSRQLMSWLMNGTNLIASRALRNGRAAAPGWDAVGADDFDKDGNSDVLFQESDGRLSIWRMAGTDYLSTVSLRSGTSVGQDWRVAALADFNNDWHKDVLFRHEDGRLLIWWLNKTHYLREHALYEGPATSTGWRIVGVE